MIDCQPAMYQPDEDGKIPVRVAFDCVASVLLNKVFSSASDQVGVLLYGTVSEETKTFPCAAAKLIIPHID